MTAEIGHATLGASSAERWINCPGSVRLIATLPPSMQNRGSRAAAEGTAAHTLVEWCLKSNKDPDEFPMKVIAVKDWSQEKFKVDDDMKDAVRECLEEIQGVRERLGVTELFVERHVRPFADRNDMWGTADITVLQNFGELHVADYKHGKGHVVEVDYNPQLMFYGLGAVQELRAQGYNDFQKIVLWISQPRAYHAAGSTRSWETTIDELDGFGETLRLAADRTKEPDALLVAGDHCKFCSAKAICPAIKSNVLQLFDQADFSASAELTLPDSRDPARIAELLQIVPRWDEFVKSLEGLAYDMANRGEKLPGWKLVRKRANRRWKVEPGKVIEAVSEFEKVEPADLMTEPELRSPAQVEKAMKRKKIAKKKRDALLATLVEKPEGGLTLVQTADARPAVETTNPVDLLPDVGDTSDLG